MKGGRAPFTPLFWHKPRGDGRPRSFHSSVWATNRDVKEGRAPFTLDFCHKPRGEGRPRSFHPWFWPRGNAALFSPLGVGHKPRGEGRTRSFHLSVLATNHARGEGRPRSFHASVLATNRDVKEGRLYPKKMFKVYSLKHQKTPLCRIGQALCFNGVHC